MLYEVSYMGAAGIPSILHVKADSIERARAYFCEVEVDGGEFCGIIEGASTARSGVPCVTVPADWQPRETEASEMEADMNINELDELVDQIRSLKRLIEDAEAEIAGLEDVIKAQMTAQDTDELKGSTSKVTWKPVSSTRIDSKALSNPNERALCGTALKEKGGKLCASRHCRVTISYLSVVQFDLCFSH